MSVLSFGLPTGKELEQMMARTISDDDRRRWHTLRDPNNPRGAQRMLNDAASQGTQLATRPLQARMQAAEHDRMRNESSQNPQYQVETDSGATKTAYQRAMDDVDHRSALSIKQSGDDSPEFA